MARNLKRTCNQIFGNDHEVYTEIKTWLEGQGYILHSSRITRYSKHPKNANVLRVHLKPTPDALREVHFDANGVVVCDSTINTGGRAEGPSDGRRGPKPSLERLDQEGSIIGD